MNKLYAMKEGILQKKGLLLERRTFKNVESFKKVFDKLLSETNIEIKKEVIQKTTDKEKYVIVSYDLGSIDNKVLRIFFEVIDEKTQEIEVDFIELSNAPSRKANTYFIYELTSASVTSNTELKNMLKAISHICSYYNKKKDLKNITNSATVFKKYNIDVEVRKRNSLDVAKFRGGSKIIVDYNSDIPEGTTVNVQDSSDPVVKRKNKRIKKDIELSNSEIQKINKEIPIEGKIEIDKKTKKRGRKKKEKPEEKEEQPVVQQAIVTNVVNDKKIFALKLTLSKDGKYYISNIDINKLSQEYPEFYDVYGKPIFYENGDTNKPINLPDKNEAELKINSLDRASIVTPNLVSSNTPMLQNPNFLCTDEQLAVRNAKESIIVNAYAGAGKTTTIIEYCLANPNEKKLYAVFSQSLQKEMQLKVEKMKIQNLDVSGTVGIMYKYYFYKTRIKLNPFSEKDLKLYEKYHTYPGIFVNPKDYDYINEDIEKVMKKYLYSFMREVHVLYCRSSENDIFSYKAEYDLKSDIEIEFFLRNKDVILNFQDKLFKAMQNETNVPWSYLSKFGAMNVHNDKDFLSKKYECLLLDEGQDTSQSIYTFIDSQTNVKKIIVGDSHQNIFGFLNTQNVLEKFNFPKLNLSSSRRYTQDVANYAMRILDEKIKVGKDTSEVMIYADRQFTGEIHSHAYIGRTNNALIKELFKTMIGGEPLDVMFFEGADEDKKDDENEKSQKKEAYNNKSNYRKSYDKNEEIKSGFEKIFLKAYDNIITADVLFVFIKSYLEGKSKIAIKDKSAWSDNYDWSGFDNENFYNNSYLKKFDSQTLKYLYEKLKWCKTENSLMQHAVNGQLEGLIRLLKLFRSKEFKDMDIDKFLEIINNCKKIESKNKKLFMDSMKNNKNLKHGLFSTIHKSKGLEYDAVTFCSDMKLPDPIFEYKTNSKGQVLFDLNTKQPILQDPVRFNKQRQDYIEEINMLYVAATRAKEKIYGSLLVKGFEHLGLENSEPEKPEPEDDELQDLENEENLEEQLMYYNKRYV